VKLPPFLTRWREALAGRAAACPKYEAIVYFEGPKTKWVRSRSGNLYEQHPGGLRIPLAGPRGEIMPAPDQSEVIQARQFKSEFCARVWVQARLRGFDHQKIVGEVRPL
jgi:hypothetical protein